MKENLMQPNNGALHSDDVHIPSVEPMVTLSESSRANDSKAVQTAGHGGMIRADTTSTEESVDDNRKEQLAQSAPALPLYLAEKYFWRKSAGGKFYLSPLPQFIAYVEAAATRAADYGIGVVYPGGEHGKTDEAELVEQLIASSKEMLFTLRALGENEGKAFERFLVERCTRNSVYAATTQFELENWASRAHARGEDASSHQNYGEKESRLQTFAIQAGVAFAVVREVLPDQPLNETTFKKAAKRIVYEAANFEGDKLSTPAQQDEQQTAAAEAARVTARRF
jgi:hypothetical protein